MIVVRNDDFECTNDVRQKRLIGTSNGSREMALQNKWNAANKHRSAEQMSSTLQRKERHSRHQHVLAVRFHRQCRPSGCPCTSRLDMDS